MNKHRFTQKQSAPLNACAADYEAMGDGVMVKAIKGFDADHSHVTAKSLEERGWLNIAENSAGEQYASFDSIQYSEFFGLNGDADDE